MANILHYFQHLEDKWSDVVSSYPAPAVEYVGTTGVMLLVGWGGTLLFFAVDQIGPSWVRRFKIQPDERKPTPKETWECFLVAARNQLIASGLLAIWTSLLHFYSPFPSSYRVDPKFPSTIEFLLGVIFSLFLREIFAYYVHYSLHQGRLYTLIHRQHHRFTAPISLAAHYAHPVEHIAHNLIPIALPPQLLRCHVLTAWFVLSVEAMSGVVRHSGYEWFGETRMHDLHHLNSNVYFGGNGLMDWIHGTNQSRTKKLS